MAHSFRRTAARRLSLWRYRIKHRAERLSRAWAYLTGGLSADAAQMMMLDCRHTAGWHPLLVLTVDDTLEQARETFVDHPELPRLIADGCAIVGDKWESFNNELYEARCWAIDAAAEYATEDGITLTLLAANDIDASIAAARESSAP